MIKLKERFTFISPFLAAGSGIVHYENRFLVVADDDLGVVSVSQDFTTGTYHQVLPGKLSENAEERKKIKPDWEAACVYQGNLLLIPSGSKANRYIGAKVSLKTYATQEISFQEVYRRLTSHFPDLNIEGAIILGETIRLFQRGNGPLAQNALIDLNLEEFLQDRILDLRLQELSLGTIEGVTVSFTDACLYKKEILFLGVAEDSSSTYLDGEYMGSIIGRMNFSGEIIKSYPLEIDSKPEGITVLGEEFFIVIDDDNRSTPSRIYSGELQSIYL